MAVSAVMEAFVMFRLRAGGPTIFNATQPTTGHDFFLGRIDGHDPGRAALITIVDRDKLTITTTSPTEYIAFASACTTLTFVARATDSIAATNSATRKLLPAPVAGGTLCRKRRRLIAIGRIERDNYKGSNSCQHQSGGYETPQFDRSSRFHHIFGLS